MSEKIQHTTASLRAKMTRRYDDGLEHKHNRDHHTYRQHCRSHPCNQNLEEEELKPQKSSSTGLIREFKLRKIRKRLDKGRIH